MMTSRSRDDDRHMHIHTFAPPLPPTRWMQDADIDDNNKGKDSTNAQTMRNVGGQGGDDDTCATSLRSTTNPRAPSCGGAARNASEIYDGPLRRNNSTLEAL